MSVKTWADYGFDPADFANEAGNVRVPCPECSRFRNDESDPCCSVHVTKRCWECKHCGWRGGLAGGHPDEDTRTKEYSRPIDDLNRELTAGAAAWLKGRGIGEATCRRNKLGVGFRWFRKAGKVEAAIRFPYYRDGALVNVKDRCITVKDFTFGLNCELTLFKLDDLTDEGIVCEGEMDALSFDEAGFPFAVSVPNGAREQISKDKASSAFSFLTADEAKIQTVSKWYIATDADKPGMTLRDELTRRLGPEKCWLVTWPEGCKDANDTLRSAGTYGLGECLKNAKPCPVEGIFYGEDVAIGARDRHMNGAPPGFPPPWPSLAKLLTFRPGEMTIITGYSHSGKSAWLDHLIASLMVDQGWPIAVYSPENYPTEAHFNTFVGVLAGQQAEGDFRMPTEAYDRHAEQVSRYVSWVYPEEDHTVEALLERVKVLVYRRGIQAFVLDPWNEMDHTAPKNLREDQYLSMALGKIRRFARAQRVHVFIVAHPTNPQKDPKTKKYPIPTLHNISGGGNWKNKADNGIVIYRDFDTADDQTTVSVQKVKFKDVGRCGTCILRYEWKSGKFYDQDEVEFAGGKKADTTPSAIAKPWNEREHPMESDDFPDTSPAAILASSQPAAGTMDYIFSGQRRDEE